MEEASRGERVASGGEWVASVGVWVASGGEWVASEGEWVASEGVWVASVGVWGVPAIHRGQLPPPECPPAGYSAHDGTNLLHRVQQTHSEAPLRQVVAHGELQELLKEDSSGKRLSGKKITGGIFVGKRNCRGRKIMAKIL